MGKVGEGPRITADLTNVGTTPAKDSNTPPPLTMAKLNGIVDECFNFNFGGPVERLTERGTAQDTPRQDGAVAKRSEAVKDFFRSIGQGISSFFSKVGHAFATAFESIKEAIQSRTGGTAAVQTTGAQGTTGQVATAVTADADTPPTLDKKGAALKEFAEELTDALQTDYEAYLQNGQDDPPMTRAEFVKFKLPDPADIDQGIDVQSAFYLGDRIDDVRANLKEGSNPDRNEMQKAVLDRLTDMPTVEIALEGQYAAELGALQTDPSTFLRGNTPFAKLDKFVGRQTVPFEAVASSVLETVGPKLEQHEPLAVQNGVTLRMSMLTDTQAVAVEDIANAMLDDLLDISGTNPNSFLNSISPSYQEFLADRADTILQQPDLSDQVKQDAIKTLYVNALILRGINGELFTAAVSKPNQDQKGMTIQTLQLVQTFVNGNDQFPVGKGNDIANQVLGRITSAHQARFDAFLAAVGMPTVIGAQTPDDQPSVTE